MAELNFNIPSDFHFPPIDSGSYFTPDRNTIPTPPDDLPVHNTYPPEEWRFSDQANPEFRDDIVEREPFDSSEPDQQVVMEEEDRRQVLEAVQEDDRVREKLSGQRHTFIGASLRNNPPKEGTEPIVDVLVYDYDRDTTILIQLTGTGDYEVDALNEIDYLPPPTVDEAKKAIELARNSEALADQETQEMEAGVLRDFSHVSGGPASDLTDDDIRNVIHVLEEADLPSYVPGSFENLARRSGFSEEKTGRRRMDVRFRMAGERAPRFYALVDLTTEKVIESGPLE